MKKDLNPVQLELALKQGEVRTTEDIVNEILPLYKTSYNCDWVAVESGENFFHIIPEATSDNAIVQEEIKKLRSAKSQEEEESIFRLQSPTHTYYRIETTENFNLSMKVEQALKSEEASALSKLVHQLGRVFQRSNWNENALLFQSMINKNSDALQVASEDGTFYFLNETASKRLGIKADEVNKYKVWDIEEVLKDRKDWNQHVEKMKTRDYLTIEGVNINQETGHKFPVEVTVRYIKVGRKGFVVATSRDISKRKRVEGQLKRATERYELAIEGSKDGIWVWNIETGEVFFSRRWKEILGYSDEELENSFNTFKSLIFEVDRPEVFEKLNAYLEGRRKNYALDFRMVHKNGSLKWIEAKGVGFKDQEGKIFQMAGSHSDITHRKNIEADLRMTKSLLEQAEKMVKVGAWEWDIPKDEISLSVVTKQILELKSDAKLNLEDVLNFSTPGKDRKKITAFISRAIEQGEGFDDTFRIFTHHGTIKWIRLLGRSEVKDGKCIKLYGTFQDVTREKQKSIELAKAKQQLESIFDEMSDVVWSMTVPDYQMTFLTPSIKKLSGYSAGFLMDQQNWWEKVVHPDDYGVIDIGLEILNEKGEYSITHKIKTKSGETKWVSNKGKYIYDENNEPVRFDAIVRDRTPQVMAERELQKELALQEIIIKISSTYINIDLQHIETVIQKSLEELGLFVHADRVYIFDYDFKEEIITNTYEWCAEGITPEIGNSQNISIHSVKDLFKRHLNGEYYYSYDISKINDPDFREILQAQGIKSLLTIPMMENESLTGFVGLDSVRKHHKYTEQEKKLLFIFAQMIINIKNRQKWENQLILQEEKYRNIISNLNLGLLNLDKNQNITFVNSIFCEMSGHQAEDILGRNIAELPIFRQSYKTVKEKEDLRKKGIPDTYDLKVNLVDGKEHWWLVSGAPNYNDKGEIVGTIGAMLDITDQKQLEQQLVYAKSQAEQAGEAKEIFLAKMSHEIRTPLSVVIGMIRQLSRSKLRGKNGFYVHQADSAARHLLTILNNILDMAKIDAGQLTLENKPFSIKYLALNLKNIFFQRASEQNITFKIYLSSNIKPALIGDEVRLKQILFNLLSNSLKFTKEGFISLVMEAVETTKTHQTVKVMVLDSGIGMTPEFVSQIFEKFSQEHDEFNPKFDGTGLGMAIARDLVVQMGGELIVESVKNVGTTVRFKIPLPIADPRHLKRIEQTDLPKGSMSKVNILVVEDNDMNRFLVRESLKVIGCQVVEAKNGKEAVELLKKHSFDLVFMDIQMPEMNGIQATKIIRGELMSEVPIIALTANAFRQDIDKYLKIGMDDFITKPYEEQDLFRKLSLHLDLSKKDENKPKKIKEIKKLYDLSSLEAMDAGNGDFLPKILNVFVDMSRKNIDQLKSAYEERDLNTIKKIAHKLKPSIDQLKIEVLKTKIREIEKYPEVDLPDPALEQLLEDVFEILTTTTREIESRYLQNQGKPRK